MENELIIDLEAFTKEDKKPPHGKKYKVKVGDHYFVFDHHIVTGKEILEKAGIAPVECYWLYQKLKGCDFEKIDLAEQVDLAKGGIEQFVIRPTEVFHYFVDGEPETTDQKELTPNQILENAGITPVKDYYLVRINPDGSQDSFKDTPDKPIKMVCPAVKFVSAFREKHPYHKHFCMAKSDFIDQLKALGYGVQEPKPGFLTFAYEIPVGKFAGQVVQMGLQVHDNFPMAPPPGPHFNPHLLPVTGGGGSHPCGAIHNSPLGAEWQYWSRPFAAEWNRTDRTVKTYLAHIRNLFATIL